MLKVPESARVGADLATATSDAITSVVLMKSLRLAVVCLLFRDRNIAYLEAHLQEAWSFVESFETCRMPGYLRFPSPRLS